MLVNVFLKQLEAIPIKSVYIYIHIIYISIFTIVKVTNFPVLKSILKKMRVGGQNVSTFPVLRCTGWVEVTTPEPEIMMGICRKKITSIMTYVGIATGGDHRILS